MMLEGRVALITGGSRGIGKAIAKRFLGEGSCVAIVARTPEEVKRAVEDLRSIGRVVGYTGDVSDTTEVEKLFDMTHEAFGRVDILVNNAAIQGPIGSLAENSPEEWLYAIKVNLCGTYICCRMAIPEMIERGSGKIINLSGGGATSPRPFFSAYAASKAAVVRLTETMAEELREFNIQVNAIAPGAVYTHMTEEVLHAGQSAGELDLEQACHQLEEGGTTPEAAASLALFLASEDSDGLTGRLISAVHDEWNEWQNYISEIESNELYTLRRLDPYNVCKLAPQWRPPWAK